MRAVTSARAGGVVVGAMRQPTYRLLVLAPLLLLLSSGCPGQGDCYRTLDVTVTLDTSAASGPEVVLVTIEEIEAGDVTGTDANGVPIAGAGATPQVAVVPTGSPVTFQVVTAPFDSWLYAFVDNDGDRVLGLGEAFGLPQPNPVAGGCADLPLAISIDRTYL